MIKNTHSRKFFVLKKIEKLGRKSLRESTDKIEKSVKIRHSEEWRMTSIKDDYNEGELSFFLQVNVISLCSQ